MPPPAPRPSLRCPGEVGPAPPWSLVASPQLPPPPGWAVSTPGVGGGSRADARPVLQGAASPFGRAGIQRTPDPGETALKPSAVRRRTRHGPVLLEAPSCPAWDSEDCLGHCWGRSPSSPSRREAGAEQGRGMSIVQPRRTPTGAAAGGGGGLRIPGPGRAAARRGRPKTRRQGRGMAAGFAFCLSPRSSTPPPLGSAPGPAAPAAAATQHGHPQPLPRVRLPSRALPHRSSLISFHAITLSGINAIGFPHAPPAPILPLLVREFFGPRDPVFSWMQGKHRVLGTVGGSHPAPARYRKKTTKSEKTQPTTCLSNAPRFFVH